VVGRQRELSAIQQGLHVAREGLLCTVLEGEPGIGKTRFLLAVEELATESGFAAVAVTADEEIRGPFLLARSIFGCQVIHELVAGSSAEQSVTRAIEALMNREAGFDSMAPDQRLVRAFDLAAVALREIARLRPLALLIDDLQWADEDSLRLLRYVVRAQAESPIFLVLALRPNESATVNEAVTLLADIERMGTLQRLRLARFTAHESASFLQQALGGRVDESSSVVMHGQAEGVPFILAEQVRAYRDAGLVQLVDGVWTLARNAERLLPSAVRTLIQRRAAKLPEDARDLLAEAAALGRGFSLRDLHDVRLNLGEGPLTTADLAASLEPAVAAGLLVQHPEGSAADYSFTHEGVREYAVGTLALPRRRAIHGAIVDMLTAGGDAPAASLSLLAGHALAAGRPELCSRAAIDAARAALRAHAPDEVLRLVNLARPVASGAQERIQLLGLRDDGLAMLRRSAQRLDGLSEMSALAEAIGDPHLELEVMLRRASALRLSEEPDTAAAVAARVRDRAVEVGDAEAELAACLELGQIYLQAEIGDATVQALDAADLEASAEAYARALELAEQRNDEAMIAATSRELGVIATCRLRAWFVARVAAGEEIPVVKALLGGATLSEILAEHPDVAANAQESQRLFERALRIYESLGDRKGIMSTVVAMASANWAPGIHLSGSVQHIEELRRLTARVKSFTRESERALADAQMLFGSHVYSRIRGFPDAAITKGNEAFSAARALGDRTLEFAVAGSLALQHAELGDAAESDRWLGRAAAVAVASQTPFRALQLELWRGAVAGERDDAPAMQQHFERAATIASEQGRPAARCDALAQLSAHAARLGSDRGDADLLARAEEAALEAEALAASLPGHPPWRSVALASRARVQLARGEASAAAELAREALGNLEAAQHADFHFDAVLPAAEALVAAGTDDERADVRDRLQLVAAMVAQRVLDEDVRVKWFASRTGRAVTTLGGGDARVLAPHPDSRRDLNDAEQDLLRLVTEARSNAEIAVLLGVTEDVVAQDLARLFAKIGAGSRADATTVALTGSLV
jgi:DNA-binding CsgD family transcriptional regulator